MLLVSKSGLVEEDAVEVWFSLLFFLNVKVKVLSGNIIIW